VIRRWDSDRFFYIVLSGRYDVFIDSRLIRAIKANIAATLAERLRQR
jgi:hypothetical protein